jgi:drug/metabolite transporter (DMT)-like permease
MIRIVLERMVLFALPFAVFALYVWIGHKRLQRPRPDTPWVWLSVIGLVLVILSFFYVGLTEGETTKGQYVPPQYVHGRIVPGHVDDGETKGAPQ